MNSLLSFELSSVDDNEMGLGGGRLVRWYQACMWAWDSGMVGFVGGT